MTIARCIHVVNTPTGVGRSSVRIRPGGGPTELIAERRDVSELRVPSLTPSRAESPVFSIVRPGVLLLRPWHEPLQLVEPVDHDQRAAPTRDREVPTVGGTLLFGASRAQHFPDAWIQAGRFHGVDKSRISHRSSREFGARFRFAILESKVFKFYGGRIGIRTNSFGRPRNTRLVFEVGAGSW